MVEINAHPERYSTGHVATDDSVINPNQTDRWCMACGAARVQGRWLVPSWFSAVDKLLQGVNGEPLS